MTSLEMTVGRVHLRVNAPAEFVEFLASDFAPLTQAASPGTVARLEVDIQRSNFVPDTRGLTFVGYRTWFGAGQLLHRTASDVHIRLERVHAEIKITCWVSDSAVQSYGSVDEVLQRVLRWTIQWPLIVLLEEAGICHFIHGTAVQQAERIYVFSGDAGVGKSTLAYHLRRSGFGTVVADNFVGLADDGIVTLPETLRLPLEGTIDGAQLSRSSLGKRHFPLDKLIPPSRPTAIVFLGRGHPFESERLPFSVAKRLHSTVRSRCQEFPEAGYLFAYPFIRESFSALRDCHFGAPHFLMRYSRDESLDAAVAWLSDLPQFP